MEFQRIDEALAGLKYPAMEVLERYDLLPGDLLVTCAGFEDRAFEYLRRAVDSGARQFSILAVDYLPSVAANRSTDVARLCDQAGAHIEWIQYNREDPHDPTPVVLSALGKGRRLLIDISGMSRLLIVQLIAAVIRNRRAADTKIIYSEAKIYPPTREEVASSLTSAEQLFGVINFISTGVLGIIVPPELSTASMYGQPIRLMAFPSFNPAQFAALRSEINASSFTIVHGEPPSDGNTWRVESIKKLNMIDGLRNVDEVTTSTLDYRDTLAMLLRQYQRYGSKEKFVIAPTGSKMQSLAVGIAVGFLKDLQIVYPAPRSFPSPANYTIGVSRIFALNLDFLASIPSVVSIGADLPSGSSLHGHED